MQTLMALFVVKLKPVAQMMLVASVGDQKGEGKGSCKFVFRSSRNSLGQSVQASEKVPLPLANSLSFIFSDRLSLREVSWSELRPVGRSCQSEEVYGGS